MIAMPSPVSRNFSLLMNPPALGRNDSSSVLELLKEIQRNMGMSVMLITHDLAWSQK